MKVCLSGSLSREGSYLELWISLMRGHQHCTALLMQIGGLEVRKFKQSKKVDIQPVIHLEFMEECQRYGCCSRVLECDTA